MLGAIPGFGGYKMADKPRMKTRKKSNSFSYDRRRDSLKVKRQAKSLSFKSATLDTRKSQMKERQVGTSQFGLVLCHRRVIQILIHQVGLNVEGFPPLLIGQSVWLFLLVKWTSVCDFFPLVKTIFFFLSTLHIVHRSQSFCADQNPNGPASLWAVLWFQKIATGSLLHNRRHLFPCRPPCWTWVANSTLVNS